MLNFDPPLVVGSENPDTVIIWLHGLGADGYNFEPVVSQLLLPQQRHIQFIFPHARLQPVTLNGGMEMRSWFDLYFPFEPGNEDIAGMNDTKVYIDGLINQQLARGIASERIILIGFSQGGAMALYSGLSFPKRLGGIVGLSTLLGGSLELETQRHAANQEVPIFLVHGSHDNVLPISLAKHSLETLERWGYLVEWHEYNMGHDVCEQELQDLSRFIGQIS